MKSILSLTLIAIFFLYAFVVTKNQKDNVTYLVDGKACKDLKCILPWTQVKVKALSNYPDQFQVQDYFVNDAIPNADTEGKFQVSLEKAIPSKEGKVSFFLLLMDENEKEYAIIAETAKPYDNVIHLNEVIAEKRVSIQNAVPASIKN